MTTDAQRRANRKYYEKVRDSRRSEMRERAKTRAEQTREYLREHPEEIEAYQKQQREKKEQYIYNGKVKRRKARIDGWLEDPDICQSFKAFLNTCVIPVIGDISDSFLDTCWSKLAIAVNTQGIFPDAEVDG
jgi:uncharacterized protein with NRDE domain